MYVFALKLYRFCLVWDEFELGFCNFDVQVECFDRDSSRR